MHIKFGTDGWRDVIARNFTFSNVRIVANSVAKYINTYHKENPVLIVGYDTRFLAEHFAREVVSVLNANNIEVFLTNRETPTPVTAFSVLVKKASGAIMLTASHNPPEYLGIKFIPWYAGPATPDITSKIEEFIDENSPIPETTRELVEIFDPMPEYISEIKKIINFQKVKEAQLKLVINPLYGTGRGYLENLLNDIAKEIIVINNYRDCLFGGGMPEPAEEFLNEQKRILLENEYDLGLALDGDADRFGVLDRDGSYINPNELISLLLYHLVKNKSYTGKVVRTVATTHLIDLIAEKLGVEVIEVPVGFKYVGKQMREQEIIIGGEESGGISIKGHIPEKDGILADMLAVEMVAYEKKSLRDCLKEIFSEVGEVYTKRINLKISENENKQKIIDYFKNDPPKLEGKSCEEINTMDGVKCIYEKNLWFMVRPSGTEPVIRVYIEAQSKEVLKNIEETVLDIINSI